MEREELNQLVEQARSGNSAAITSLVKAYHHQVKDKIRSAGVPEEDQKNAEIHSFSSAFAHISNLPQGGDFNSFLDGYVTKEIQKYMVASEQSISDILSGTDDDLSFGPFGSSPSSPDSPVKISAPQLQQPVEEQPEPVKPAKVSRPTVTEEDEDDEEEEEEKPRRLFGSKKKKKVVEEEDEDDEEDEDEDEKPRGLFHRHRKQDDDEDDEDEEEEEEKPRRSARRKKVVEEDEDDDDEDYEEGGGIPGWLLGVLIGILAVVALALVLYIFVPKVYDSTFGRIPFLPSADVQETATPSATPTATIETTPTPTVEATATPDASADASATASSSSETTATATATATASTTTTGSAIGRATVNVSGLNIRSSASTGGSVVGTATSGQTYDVYSSTTSGGYTWYQIGNNQWIADNGSWVTYKAN
ncbi:MAG TPA: hypothetical protein DGT58_07425 [Erysipelotrichaceae bacterium]|nr:hypothetical protein [Erysipelotrichaceae bacterium]